ncbi:hypothetical protein LIER_37491 [Lithospermum erythrorhizon]|uniref:Uncharacterized protein n=1 Tax=Lithospermum erythrorhizon TaxID=34254 RepID=A0AAV3PKZ4_LITER
MVKILTNYEEASSQKINFDQCGVNFEKRTNMTVRQRALLRVLIGLWPSIGGLVRIRKGKYIGRRGSRWCWAKEEGGMGFKDLECMNLALLSK